MQKLAAITRRLFKYDLYGQTLSIAHFPRRQNLRFCHPLTAAVSLCHFVTFPSHCEGIDPRQREVLKSIFAFRSSSCQRKVHVGEGLCALPKKYQKKLTGGKPLPYFICIKATKNSVLLPCKVFTHIQSTGSKYNKTLDDIQHICRDRKEIKSDEDYLQKQYTNYYSADFSRTAHE